ncbi:catechol 2,3-dioxygenase-like lactoylglutathione lyase family enzyme [Novosphingobium chloroacetimidivorans]|uniref:Catechol 2,3-dioxygenase-like lactoylglutathione lyase family enzyme n=1 Tax=Novosphingobium chloroacetimidivorans TaxID=1428314 RepID=A0A7W7KAB2_9SPHN|nr:VOC family protein [Novosphingobium chloroacetimidivorans]MBB4859122.1 catechol 2,3-dioxygenase-like lactoylglutathione lyase family enzyme [Novosphingobium chloroacetimidivorans]
MPVSGIDHVNILTRDLDATATFYERLLGLARTENESIAAGFRGAWMRDKAGNAIVHLVWKDPASDRYGGYEPGQPTNAVHHVAFRCEGFEAIRDALDAQGIGYRVNDRQYGSVRQIFLVDPNAVNLELNFAGD